MMNKRHMTERCREGTNETYWPLWLVKRVVRLAKARAYETVIAAEASGEPGWAQEYARNKVRELRGEK